MKVFFAILALVLAALVLPFLLPGAGSDGRDPERGLPWQIAVDDQGGSEVFGLRLGQSTLGDARRVLGEDWELAVIAAPGEEGAIEAYCAQAKLGFVLARVIVTGKPKNGQISQMRERALKAEAMESTTRKITLHPDDRAAAELLPIQAISVIPAVNLDESALVQRFGKPAERLQVSASRLHLLYPDKGLDILVDADGKELLQYVAPRDFALLRDPLR